MRFLIFILLLFLLSCDDKLTNSEESINIEPVVYFPIDSGSWDGEDTIFNEFGMRKIYADGYSFYPRSRGELRCSLSYNFFIDTTEVTEIQFFNLMSHLIPQYKISERFSRPAVANVGNAMLYCNERSKAGNRDTVYVYDSIVIDSNFSGQWEQRKLINARMNLDANGFRLPLSNEWTYAYRGGHSSDYFWGTDLFDEEVADIYAWYERKGGDWYPVPVAYKEPNPYGLYDMIGNIKESVHYIHYDDSVDLVIDPMPCTDTLYGYKYLASMGADWTSRRPYQQFTAWEVETGTGFGFRTILLEEIPENW